MNIENAIFKRTHLIIKKLISYGFKKENEHYIYECNFHGGEFNAIITIKTDGTVKGKIVDNETNEEYTNIRTEMTGEFVNKIREEYKNILIDIRNNCFETNYFISNQANRISKYIKDQYNVDPEFLWEKYPGCAIYRNVKNRKWFGIIMNIDLSKLEDGNGEVEIINVKCSRSKIENVLKIKGIFEAYHMSKKDWVSIILNNTLNDDRIIELINESYQLIDTRYYKE